VKANSKQRPLVGIAVDGITGYGRAVMRGFMRYANLQRRWLIHEEMRRISSIGDEWPDCDGAIVAGLDRVAIERLLRITPCVVHCSSSGNPDEAPVVCLDDAAAGETAAQHLMDCRLEHFAFYGRGWSATSVNRSRGFIDGLSARGYSCSSSPIDWPEPHKLNKPHWPELIDWLRQLPKPVGIMAFDDSAAHDLAAACLSADLAVPEQVAIIGVNNDDLLCESAWPPLSSVEVDFSRMGYAAGSVLERMLDGKKIKGPDRLTRLAPLGVVGRLSTDVLAVDEPQVAEAIRFIRTHACDPCNVADLLREVPVNRRWLERQFAQKLGRTPHDEIMRVRMETAKRLLLRPELSLEQIAFRCGFTAVSNFGRVFSQTQSTTPAAYRREALKGAK
jgi:LacI family transcriptional regulator